MRPKMTLTPEEIDRFLTLGKDEEVPATERRPDLAQAWAQRMNDVPEVCPHCNKSYGH